MRYPGGGFYRNRCASLTLVSRASGIVENSGSAYRDARVLHEFSAAIRSHRAIGSASPGGVIRALYMSGCKERLPHEA
jgi:hypothetical protein